MKIYHRYDPKRVVYKIKNSAAHPNLSRINLSWADLTGADLSGAFNIPEHAVPLIVPQGNIIGWKKCLRGSATKKTLNKTCIVKLLIPKESQRSNATTRKCRAQFARVLKVYGDTRGISMYESTKCIYTKGETVYCDRWEANRWVECGGGIHFFLTKQEAEEFKL